MRKYSEDQKNLYYLSPYTAVKVFDGSVFVHQRLFDLTDQIQISQDVIGNLLNGLSTGITEIKLKDMLSKDGFINSNYGWCIYSKDNYKQYDNSLLELIKNQDSRRACMIYNRPSMWEDYKKDGMNEFICTFSTQQFIRNNKLIYIIYQRSADAIFGALFVDFAWHCEVYIKLYNNLKKHYNNLEIGQIDFNCGSLHIYERHFEMLDKICETKI